jgi:hypothetical protein
MSEDVIVVLVGSRVNAIFSASFITHQVISCEKDMRDFDAFGVILVKSLVEGGNSDFVIGRWRRGEGVGVKIGAFVGLGVDNCEFGRGCVVVREWEWD